jgi:hypothetical protein
MTRDMTPANIAASKEPQVYAITMAELKLDSGDINVHTSIGPIDFNGTIYQGIGDFGDVSEIEENIETSASNVDLSLSGINNAYVSVALNENYQGREVNLYIGLIDISSNLLIADPTLIFRGDINSMNVQVGETTTVTVNVTNKLVNWQKVEARRYTDADHRSRFPDDGFFKYVDELEEREILWNK